MVNVKELKEITKANFGLDKDEILRRNLAKLEQKVTDAAKRGENHIADVTWQGFWGNGKEDAYRALSKFAEQSGCSLRYHTNHFGSEFYFLEW